MISFILSIPRHGVLVSFKQSTVTAQPKEGPLDDTPSRPKPLADIPGPKGIYNLPVLGNAFHFAPYLKNGDSHLYFRELNKQYGKIVRVRLGPNQTVMLFDPELISQTVAKEGTYPVRRSVPIMETYVKRTKRNMLSVQNGPEWQSYRSAAQQSVKPTIIKNYIEPQAQCADDLVTWLGNHGNDNPEVKFAFMRYSADANAVLTFDKKIGFLKNSENLDPELELFLNSIRQFMVLIGQSIFSLPWYRLWRTKLYTDFENATNNVYRISEKYIEEARMELLKSKNGESDIAESDLTVLKCLFQDNRLTNQTITDVMAAFLFAGVEQVSQALIWMFWLIGKSPEKQAKLYEEISSNIGSSPITAANLGYLPYLKACVKESFRCVPPVASGTARVLQLDTEIGGYLIPKGTTVMFGNNTLSMSEEQFANPEEFLPERWLDSNDPQKQRLMSMCVLPFGIGKRNCLGRRFAEQEIHLATIKILQNFHVEVTGDCRDAKPTYTTFAEPDRPIKFIFDKR